jgi:molybdopterin synthase catalytic subunit
VVTFHGVTRSVPRLDYEAFVEMAEQRLAGIAQECLRRHGLCRVAIEHRIGSVPLGEPSVVVAVSAAHRAEAFAGARAAIDLIKQDVPIWKREHDGSGAERWVHGA